MSPSRVLVIDPQSVERTLFEGCLLGAGWGVFVCHSAGDAFDILQTEEVQLVICAHRPPDLDALAFCSQAQPLLGSQRIPVVLTGDGQALAAEVVAELGPMIARVLPDPVYLVELRAAIDEILGSHIPKLLQDSNPPPLPLVTEGLALADLVRALGKGGHDLQAVVSSLSHEPADPLAGKVSGVIDFFEGRPVNAELDGTTGPEVFFRLMSWRRTRIELREPPETFTPTIEDPPEDLLLEGTRRHIEWLKQKTDLPDATDTPVNVDEPEPAQPDALAADDFSAVGESDISEDLVDAMIAVSRELPALEGETDPSAPPPAPANPGAEELPPWVEGTVVPQRPRRVIALSAAVAGLAAGALWFFHQGPGEGIFFGSTSAPVAAPPSLPVVPALAWYPLSPGGNYVERADRGAFRGSLGIPNFVEVPAWPETFAAVGGERDGGQADPPPEVQDESGPPTVSAPGGESHQIAEADSSDELEDNFSFQDILVPLPKPERSTDPWSRQIALQARQRREHASALPPPLPSEGFSETPPAPSAQPEQARRVTPSPPPREGPSRSERGAQTASAKDCLEGDHDRFRSFLKACERALEDFPDHPKVLTAIAERAYQTGRYSVSGRWSRKALRAGARDPDLYRYLGFAEERAGRTEASRQAYARYLERVPQGEHADKVRALLAQPR